MRLPAPASQQTAAALLKIGGLNLLLPQSDIRTLESVTDVDHTAPALNSMGWIVFRQKRWPVYSLSENLALLTQADASQRACVMLEIGAGYIGVLCNDVAVVQELPTGQIGLPVAMKRADTPILGLVQYGQGIACLSDASHLTAFIDKLVALA